jgi:mono/diheme cytochrome c family protein
MSTTDSSPTPPDETRVPDNAPDAPDYVETVDVGKIHAAIKRERVEPVSGNEPAPLWLLVFVLVLAFWSGAYLMSYSGGFSGLVYDTNAAEKAAASGPVKAEDPVAMGERYFKQTCAVCHQATGLGMPGTYPPLAGSEYALGDERRVAAIVLHGVSGPITVHGQTFNNQMQAWGPTLNDKRIAYILTYVRQAWGNNAPAIKPETVAEVRKATASRNSAWTEAELKAFK